MQKSMLERRSMDDNQYSYMKGKMERELDFKPRLIRPLEEVMEEEQPSHVIDYTSNNIEEMDVEDVKFSSKPVCPVKTKPAPAAAAAYYTPFVGIGPSGISPLVLSDPRVAVSFTSGSDNNSVRHQNLKTGIGFHSAMLKHQCHCENTRNHPENPERF